LTNLPWISSRKAKGIRPAAWEMAELAVITKRNPVSYTIALLLVHCKARIDMSQEEQRG
jgi:hypothetical protein